MKKYNNVLIINSGGGLGDTLQFLPIINFLNKELSIKKIFYFSNKNEFFFNNILKRINKINKSRQNSFKYYCKKLSNVDGILLPSQLNLKENACHLFVISIDKSKFGINRNRIHEKLLKKGIYTSIHYKPLHLFTLFKNKSKISVLSEP